MVLNWLNTKEVDALADELTRELLHRVPPSNFGAAGKKAASKQARTQQVVLQRARQFADSCGLNVYKKARLANRLKWSLRDAGYPADFVDALAYEVAAVMATKRGAVNKRN